MTATDAAMADSGRTASPDTTADPSVPRRLLRLALPSSGAVVAVATPTIVLIAHSWFYGQWIEDDAGITFAYARSLAEGAGPVLQPGAAPVEAFSNPAWLAILVVGHWLGVFDHGAILGQPDLVLFPKVVAIACCAAMFAGFLSVARAVSPHPFTVTMVAGTITALVPSFVIWTTSGLENALYALLVVSLGAALARAAVAGRLLSTRTALVCGVLAGVAALTRPDGLIYGAAYPVAILLVIRHGSVRTSARAALVSLGAFAIPVGLYFVVRLAVFGDWLPNTARAKSQGLPSPAELGKPVLLIAYAGWLTVLLAAGLVTMALQRRTPTRTAVAMLGVPLALAVVAFAVLAPDWMAEYRFATPVWPLGAIVLTVCAGHARPVLAARARLLGALAAVLAVALTASGWVGAAAAFQGYPTAPMCYIARSVGQRTNAFADILRVPQGSLLAVDGGGTALTTRLRFIDLSGLGDARIARLWAAGDMPGLRDLVFDVERPTFLRVDNAWGAPSRSGLIVDPRLDRDYVQIAPPAPGNGTWVRRDAVPDDRALTEVRTYARQMLIQVDLPDARGDLTEWRCGAVLRPPSPRS